MTNVLSMDPGDRFRRLMESGLCAAAASRPLLPGPATGAGRCAVNARLVNGKESLFRNAGSGLR